MTTVPIRVIAFPPTDELTVAFYDCVCGFARVPRAIVDAYTTEHAEPEDQRTARFCPGCGQRITWIEGQ